MTEDEILDRIVEIIEIYDSVPFPPEISVEWGKLNDRLREFQKKPSYGLGFWHKGYEIELYGHNILYSEMTKEQYCDMMKVFSCGMKIEEYKEKWKPPCS